MQDSTIVDPHRSSAPLPLQDLYDSFARTTVSTDVKELSPAADRQAPIASRLCF